MEVSRTVYPLVSIASRELAGLVWFSPRKYGYEGGGFGHTFGIRLFDGFVGRGLSQEAMQHTHADYAADLASDEGVWLSADQENKRAIRAYERFGYRHSVRVDGLVYMVRSFVQVEVVAV
jgi:ribosomal protein S18 acetylase RimI-like enzyme